MGRDGRVLDQTHVEGCGVKGISYQAICAAYSADLRALGLSKETKQRRKMRHTEPRPNLLAAELHWGFRAPKQKPKVL